MNKAMRDYYNVFSGAFEKVNRKFQGVTQLQPWHQGEEKKDKNQRVQNKQTHAREAHTSSRFPKRGDHNAKRTEKKHENKEQGQT